MSDANKSKPKTQPQRPIELAQKSTGYVRPPIPAPKPPVKKSK